MNNLMKFKRGAQNSIRIYKRDMKIIFTNYVTLVIIIGLIILPCLYAWFNIQACWDPYSNTKALLVAVVNKDKGSEYRNIKVTAGKDIENKLKGNDKIGWKFVSESEASNGVKNGKYYASITITDDFSKNLISIATEDIPKKAELIYSVNEKKNAIATKITDKGTSTLQEEITKEFIQTASDNILLYLNQLGVNLKENKSTLEKLANTIIDLDTKMPEISEALNSSYNGSNLTNQYINNIQSDIPTLTNSLSNVLSLAKNNNNNLLTMQSAMGNVASTVASDHENIKEATNNAKELLAQVQNLKPVEVDSIVNTLKIVRDGYSASIQKVDNAVSVLEGIKSRLIIIPNGILSNKLESSHTKLQDIRNNLVIQVNNINSMINSINKSTDYVNNTLSNDIKASIQSANNISDLVDNSLNNFNDETIPTINETTKNLIDNSNDTVILLQSAQNNIPLLSGLLQSAGSLNSLGGQQLKDIKDKLPALQTEIHSYSQQLKSFQNDGKLDGILNLLKRDAKEQSDFLAEPISVNENEVYPIPNYGSAMSPFYSTLAIWVGAFVLLSLLSVNVKRFDGESELGAREQFFGRYLTFVTIAMLQALIITVGDILLLKTYVASPVVYVIYAMYVSIIFTMVIYTLVTVFGNIGKAIAMVAMVLQVSSSGGTFPVELTPSFFQSISPALPFTYSIGGMRETVGGILIKPLLSNTACLLVFFFVFMLIGILYKEKLNKINEKFIEQFKESGLAGE